MLISPPFVLLYIAAVCLAAAWVLYRREERAALKRASVKQDSIRKRSRIAEMSRNALSTQLRFDMSGVSGSRRVNGKNAAPRAGNAYPAPRSREERGIEGSADAELARLRAGRLRDRLVESDAELARLRALLDVYESHLLEDGDPDAPSPTPMGYIATTTSDTPMDVPDLDTVGTETQELKGIVEGLGVPRQYLGP